MRPTLLSNNALQYSGPYCLSASMSCTTSNKPPSSDLQEAYGRSAFNGHKGKCKQDAAQDRHSCIASALAALGKEEGLPAHQSQGTGRSEGYSPPVDDLIEGVGLL